MEQLHKQVAVREVMPADGVVRGMGSCGAQRVELRRSKNSVLSRDVEVGSLKDLV